jgi:hypothetical protein
MKRVRLISDQPHGIEVPDARICLVAQHALDEGLPPELLAGLGRDASVFKRSGDRVRSHLTFGVFGEYVLHDRRLVLVDGVLRRGVRRPANVVVSVDVVAAAEEEPLREPLLLAAGRALDDLRAL